MIKNDNTSVQTFKPLPCKKEIIISVNEHELNEFIKQVYRKPYDFQECHECSNDSLRPFECNGKEELNKEELKAVEEFKAGASKPGFRILLQDLVNRDLLEPGQYIVFVSW